MKRYVQVKPDGSREERTTPTFISRRPMFSFPWIVVADLLLETIRLRKSGRLPLFQFDTSHSPATDDNVQSGIGNDEYAIDFDDIDGDTGHDIPRFQPVDKDEPKIDRVKPLRYGHDADAMHESTRVEREIVVQVENRRIIDTRSNTNQTVSMHQESAMDGVGVDVHGCRLIAGMQILELDDDDDE
jgi:hypothetical protein